MIISPRLIKQLIDHAQAEAPLECCGIIGGHDGEAVEVYPCENAAASEFRYEIEGDDQFHTQLRMERAGDDLLAIYHSHTHAPPVPSETDVRTWRYPGALCVIIGWLAANPDPEVRAWRIADGLVTRELLMEGGDVSGPPPPD